MPNSSDGVPLQPLEVTLFNNSYDKDRFENTAWTLNGKVGDLKRCTRAAISSVTSIRWPTTRTMRAAYSPTTISAMARERAMPFEPGGNGDPNLTSTCFSPSSTWQETERNEHLSNEIRAQHAGRLAHSRHRRRVLRTEQAVRPDRLVVQEHSGLHLERRSGHPGKYGLLVGRRHGAGRDHRESRGSKRQRRVLRGHSARGQADGVLRVGRLRHHSEGADGDRRHAALPIRELLHRQRHQQLLLLRAGRPGRRMLERCHQSQRQEPQFHGIRHQEPREHHLACHAGRDAVRDLVARVPPGRLQSQRRRRPRSSTARTASPSSPYRTSTIPTI